MERVTDHELSTWRYFIKAHAMIIERIEQDLASQKRVPLTTYDVLIALFEAPERKLRLGDLNKKVVLSKSGLTRLVDRMVREGFIRREKSKEDKRGAYAELTEAGESELIKAWPIYAQGIKEYFSGPITDEDMKSLNIAFKTVFQSIQLSERNDDSKSTSN